MYIERSTSCSSVKKEQTSQAVKSSIISFLNSKYIANLLCATEAHPADSRHDLTISYKQDLEKELYLVTFVFFRSRIQ